MSRLDLGYKTDHLLLVSMNTAGSAATPAVNRVLLERLRERLRAIPGVGSVSHARWTSGWSEASGATRRTIPCARIRTS